MPRASATPDLLEVAEQLNGSAVNPLNPAEIGGRPVPRRKGRKSTAAEQGRQRGGKPYSKEPRPRTSEQLQRMAQLGCRVQVQRRQKRTGGSETLVSYTRACTDDERANYAWRNEELQLEILSDLHRNLERNLKEARRKANPTLDSLVQAMADAWALTMQRFGHLLTPITAWAYWDATLRPAATALGLVTDEGDDVPRAVQRNTIGEVEEVLDVIQDIQVADTILIWFGRESMNVLLDAPVDIPSLLVEPGSTLLDAEQTEWVRNNLEAGEGGFPSADSESSRVARQYGVNPADADNIWQLLGMVRDSAATPSRANPVDVRDHAKWHKAEEFVDRRNWTVDGVPVHDEDELLALKRHIYEKMGGRYHKAATESNPARAAAPENEQPYMSLGDVATATQLAEEAGIDTTNVHFLAEYRKAGGDFTRLPIRFRRRRAKIAEKAILKAMQSPGALWRGGVPTNLAWRTLLWGINLLPPLNYQSLMSRPATGRLL